jgi:hypothetical protein
MPASFLIDALQNVTPLKKRLLQALLRKAWELIGRTLPTIRIAWLRMTASAAPPTTRSRAGCWAAYRMAAATMLGW